MIIRVVRMTFKEAELAAFLEIFNSSKHQIRSFPGCLHLELLQDADKSNVLCTYSKWMGVESLEAYRQSDLFKKTWAATKVLFEDKPVATSMFIKELVEVL